ncbi:sulfide/dihydroorotate dehydrogenase-like FAD/NAD-binding protein [Tropicimonas isoalkanivorans]|uniref:Sulfide dehydrogenase (Flavoprotein) subunit SudB n=1 Tax=Tropicimonas isoalkanivorans TaxID=441112 RepID=A0A1I1R6T2_9RHOB|nr:sulfide/dihydroorotate dehydrogenase-like FAD/NAD-binding protein [Tropicimonas isoalkanivorans]SFD27273.1 sulfide dehydrogenase (flavoprotein) subunit SudB [Tropicimonas isoalkanivorans]
MSTRGNGGGVAGTITQPREAGPPDIVSSDFPIVTRTDFSDTTFLLEILHPAMAKAAKPGQFVIVMVNEHGERIPLTIADFDRQRGTITLVIQAVGKSSREMQAECRVGGTLFGMVGPMGIPSHVSDAKKVICVGGGLGVAPIFPQARAFKENGAYVIGVVGFRSANLIFWEHKFRSVCDEFIICTDDGSAGLKGLVTQGIEGAIAEHGDIDEVVAIGPPIMMRACAEATRPHKIKTMVSLNPIMVDGTGMCGGCRVRVGGRIKFACVDGPDFDGHAVDFDDLMQRLKRYRPQEQQSLEQWDENCRRLQMAPADAAGHGSK